LGIIKVIGFHHRPHTDISHAQNSVIQLLHLDAEVDEIWNFLGSKENKQWAWIAIDTSTKKIVAFYVGNRSASSAQELWRRIPPTYRACATFYTDGLPAYKTVVPSEKHKVRAKKTVNTYIIERFNCTLRQRVSRLVRC
jgi:insertion element IS1 protein InsB